MMKENERPFFLVHRKRNLLVANFFASKEFLFFYILHLLDKKECYGDEIAKKLAKLIDEKWKPNPGFIYPALKKMSFHGLIDGQWFIENSRPKFIYYLTEKGREVYNAIYPLWKENLGEFIKLLSRVEKEV